jgi:L-histidine N-alpha-methyltransferase
MHLVSRVPQRVLIPGADLTVAFDAAESIWTESSNKYIPATIAEFAAGAGFRVRGQQVDAEAGFALSLTQAT